VSPPELAETVDKARDALKGGVGRPLAWEGAAAGKAVPKEEAAPARAAVSEQQEGGAGFLTEGFKRYIASKNKQEPNVPFERQNDPPPRNPGALNPGVRTVLKLFQGTIVANPQEDAGNGY
jgi:hypothetical protein